MSVLDELRSLTPEDDVSETEILREILRTRITVLSERAWERRVSWDLVDRWLNNFTGASGFSVDQEQIHALYLLSQFLYFGDREIRVLLKALYRDLFLIPLIQEVRTKNRGLRDPQQLRRLTGEAIERTRFLGVGNPSESGVHLLYFFRQENGLRKHHFLDTAQLLERIQTSSGEVRQLRYPDIDRYVFVDDVCGSGETAVRYSKDFLIEIQGIKPSLSLSYLSIFATTTGIQRVRDESIFGAAAAAVYELDNTYRCVSEHSRYLKVVSDHISPEVVRKITLHYGEQLWPGHPGGYLNGELLLGFHHNTPDNTIPIIWMDKSHGAATEWTPVFRRYPKA